MRKHEMISTSGAPTITFDVRSDTIYAELAGARLYAEARGGESADLRLVDASHEVLADLVVNRRAHRNLTENVMDVGSALLWSHWRYVQSKNGGPQASTEPPAPPDLTRYVHSKLCPLCDAAPGADCVVWPQFGKLYSGCELRMSTKKTIGELVAASSIGAGLADIQERGIDAHLADLEKRKF